MARGVLGRWRALSLVVVLGMFAGAANGTDRPLGPCSGFNEFPEARQKEARDLRLRVRSGPFYQEMVRRLGKPATCKVDLDGDNLSVSYGFKDDGRLEARTNPKIEFSEQSMRVHGINSRQALTLLKQSERDAFGKDGCGIDWSHPAEDSPGESAGSREVSYRGKNCNCQGRILYKGKSIVGLILRSAC